MNTPKQAPAPQSATRYAASVTDHTTAALDAKAEIEAHLRGRREAIRRRDQAILRMHEDDGMRAPEVGRTLGMSTSNVRIIIGKTQRDTP